MRRWLGDGYVIDGAKRWIGNATFADGHGRLGPRHLLATSAPTPEKGTPGVEARLITGKIAKRASWQADVTFDDVRVPAENHLQEATSFAAAVRVLTAARPGGAAWGASATPSPPTRPPSRTPSGASYLPLGGHQLTQYRLAKMLADVTATRLVCTRLAQLTAAGKVTPAMASLAKMHSAARARAVVAEARDLLGGNGLLLENEVARHLGDVEVASTVEGN